MASGALSIQMIKKIFLLSLFFYTIFITAKLSPVAADNCPTGKCCIGTHSSSMVYLTGCKFFTSIPEMGGNYCGNDGYTGDYCECPNPNNCTCTTHSWDDGDYGKSCGLTPGTVENCWCQKAPNIDCTVGGNVLCRTQGPYSDDVCGCAATGQGCVLIPGSYERSCCAPGSGCGGPGQPTSTPQPPAPTATPGGPTLTPSPTQAPIRRLTVEINVYRASNPSYNPADNSCDLASGATSYTDAWVNLQYPFLPDQNQMLRPDENGFVTFDINGVAKNDQLTIEVLPDDTSYSCTCPNDCIYALTVPPDVEYGDVAISRNIYLSNFTDSWWQVVGGNAFVNGMLKSIVPDHLCTSPTCLAGVFLPLPSQSAFTSGFPFLHGTNLNSISTHQNATENLANIHLSGQRTNSQSADGLVLGFTPTDLNYNYFYQLATNNGTINNVTSLDLAQWRADTNHNTQGLTIFKLPTGDQTINQNNNLFVQNGERVVIFVDGNLTIENNPFVSGQKITTVNQGGFLGIFVSGDIIIEPNVGTALDTGNPANITPVTLSNTHLNGVFFSDGTLTIEGDTSYPNYKFIGAGTFIGKTSVTLGRQTNDDTKIHNSYQALESFIYRPDLLVNWPNELKSSIINWREVAPKSLN